MIFVSAPYTNKDQAIVEQRVVCVKKYVVELFNQGKHATSPVLMHDLLSIGNGLPNTFEFWSAFSFDLLKRCDEIHVLMIDGWEQSEGVLAEIEFARFNKIPVVFKTV